jgi:hypothetical protein
MAVLDAPARSASDASLDSMRGSSLRVIVTGCGRSGTNYLAEILNVAGLRCGHEKAFTVLGPREAPDLDAESSWYAAPYLGEVDGSTKVLHVIRHPARVVRSFFRIGLCATDPWHHFSFGRPAFLMALKFNVRLHRYRRRWQSVMAHRELLWNHTTCMKERAEVDRLWAYWWQWNALVEEKAEQGRHAYLRVRLEDLDASLPRIRDFLALSSELEPRPPVNQKTGYRMRPMEWTPMPEEVRSLARRYGYRDEELDAL